MPFKETLILRVILFKNVKNKEGSFAVQQPWSCIKPCSPVLWDQNLYQWESKSTKVVLVSVCSTPKEKKKSQLSNHKVPKEKENLFIDLPTTTVSESPRWGLEWTKLLRLGWGGSFGWWVGGEGRPATGPKKVSLCNKTSFDNKQNKKQKDQWQASSWRLLVRLAVGRLSPL